MKDKIGLEKEAGRNVSILVAKSKEGDLQSFSELIRFYREKAYGLAFSFLQSHHDAEDISQEAFIQVFKKLDSFDPSGSFGAWLLTIVANMSKNKLRWRRIRERVTFSLDATANDSEENELPKLQIADTNKEMDPVSNVEKSGMTKRLAGAVDTLPLQQRTAIHLKFVQGYTLLEIAKMMNLAEGTVKTHIFRGVESLKKTMEKMKDEL